MKILNVNSSLDPHDGGTSERTLQMSRHLHRAGVDVRLLVTDKHFDEVRLGGFPEANVIKLQLLNERFYLPAVRPGTISSIVAQADVIHLMSHWTYLNAIVARSAMRLGKPYVVCPAGALKITGGSVKLKRMYERLIGRRMVRHAARMIAVTPSEIGDFTASGADPARTAVLPNAIDPGDYAAEDDAAFRARFRLPDRPFVLFLGRLHPTKGPDLLLEAFLTAGGPAGSYDLVFAGPDGGLRQSLEAWAAAAGSGRVHFIGHISGEQKSHALHAASILAVPSRREAMSIVAVEAGASGTPVLLTNTCGFDDVESFGGGKVVPPTVDGLRDGLRGMLGDDRDLRRMGARFREECLRSYSWTARAREFIALYEEVLAEQHG